MDDDEERRFPVLDSGGLTIPWALVEPLRRSCRDFHGQSLERLAARGGLSVDELYFHAHRDDLGSNDLFSGKVKQDAAAWWPTFIDPPRRVALVTISPREWAD